MPLVDMMVVCSHEHHESVYATMSIMQVPPAAAAAAAAAVAAIFLQAPG
jgi:hypothetical protein